MFRSVWRLRMLLLVAMCFALTLTTAMTADTDEFPLRKKWPQLTPISTQELAAARAKNEAIVVDVRSASEYAILHVAESYNIPHDRIGLRGDSLWGLTERPHRFLVFYCNGKTCMTSYKAAEIAKSLGHGNVRVYDDGIFEWVKAYPEETVLFGRPVTRELVEQYVINDEYFDRGPWTVDNMRFIGMAKSGDYRVVDIRGPMEKRESPITLPNLSEVTLDQLVERLEREDFPKARILIVDNQCKQAIWAKYYLDRHGIKDCFFLRGGVRQWRADDRVRTGDKLGWAWGRPSPK